MSSQLVEFLEGRKEKAHGIDWEEKKREWLDAVPALYSQIKAVLGATIDKGLVKLHEEETKITEDFIGTYEVRELRLTVGDDLVVFTPIGANVVGALGRVDMRGDRDTISLLWTGGNWQFVVEQVPDLVMTPLDHQSLLNALQRVMLP